MNGPSPAARNPARRRRRDPRGRVSPLSSVSASRRARTAPRRGPGAASSIAAGIPPQKVRIERCARGGERREHGTTCRQEVFPVSTRNGGRCKVLVPEDRLFDDVQTVPDRKYSRFGRTQHRRRMTCPAEQKKKEVGHAETIARKNPLFFPSESLTFRNFLVQETNAIMASQRRSRSACDPQGPCMRPLFDLDDLQRPATSGRPYSGSLSKPSWQHLGNM